MNTMLDLSDYFDKSALWSEINNESAVRKLESNDKYAPITDNSSKKFRKLMFVYSMVEGLF